MSNLEINSLAWQKMDGLIPAIIQHAENGKVLMLGYMNQEALIATVTSGQLTLYSRSKQKLWRKGYRSGTTMAIQHISADYDNDSLLIQVLPNGSSEQLEHHHYYQPPFNNALASLDELIQLINKNKENNNAAKWLDSDANQCAQKVSAQATEIVIAAVQKDKDELIKKCASLIFHVMVLLEAQELRFYDVLTCLQDYESNLVIMYEE